MLLTAREAAERLGVKIETLYAYVSRGLIGSVEVEASRARQYDSGAVERPRRAHRARSADAGHRFGDLPDRGSPHLLSRAGRAGARRDRDARRDGGDFVGGGDGADP